jgi:hypothetical protein
MKKQLIFLTVLMFFINIYGQNKKEQIEILNNRVDSLKIVLDNIYSINDTLNYNFKESNKKLMKLETENTDLSNKLFISTENNKSLNFINKNQKDQINKIHLTMDSLIKLTKDNEIVYKDSIYKNINVKYFNEREMEYLRDIKINDFLKFLKWESIYNDKYDKTKTPNWNLVELEKYISPDGMIFYDENTGFNKKYTKTQIITEIKNRSGKIFDFFSELSWTLSLEFGNSIYEYLDDNNKKIISTKISSDYELQFDQNKNDYLLYKITHSIVGE